MKQYNVTGMSCAACVSRVEKAVSKVPGVTSCSVSLLTNSMGVEGTASAEEIVSAVKNAGYGASVKEKTNAKFSTSRSENVENSDKGEKPALLKRLVWSAVFLLVLMYFSMGHMMWNFPLPKFFDGNHVAMGLVQLLLTIVIIIINRKFFTSGFKALLNRSPNMDTLVALGASASFGWSLYVLFKMTSAQTLGNTAEVERLMMEFYFESAAMILTLITVGKALEARSKGKTTDALKGLMSLAPKTATLVTENGEKTVAVEEVQKGDIFAVRPGESIPVDAVIIEGSSAINESALTGESIPADKTAGDSVSAGTINQSGFLKCKATRVGEDTTLSKIIQMVTDAAATKAPIAKIADKVSGVFVPVVISIAVVTTIVWLIINGDVGYALARGISVLVISCPCALGLATPVAIMVGSGVGAKNGVLFKTAAALEETGRIKTVILDKTGTITEGKPKVTDIKPFGKLSESELLSLAYALETKSEHPLAAAINEKAKEQNLEPKATENFKVIAGNGLSAELDGKRLFGGSKKYISSKIEIGEEAERIAKELSKEGKTPMFFAKETELLGIIAVADTIKKDSAEAVKELRAMGMKVVMLTGDNENTAEVVGKKAGVDEIIANVLPDGKREAVENFKKCGKVAMIGDGINDAPALTGADVGIAIGAGTDIAIDSADVVLMKSSLADAVTAIRLSKATLKNIRENLFWAFIYNVIGIPLAAGVFIPLGLTLNPMFGAAAMSLSSFCVVTNALRLNLFKTKKKGKEERKMEKTMKIEGMMCPHCEAAVKKALEAIDGVAQAQPDHTKNSAKVVLSGDVADEVLVKAVVDAGYKAEM